MTIDTPANRFFTMIAATAIDAGVKQILKYAEVNGLPAQRTAQLLTAELLYCACLVGRTAGFEETDLHGLLDEMRDEADEAADREKRQS
jgi:hypothetical protein